MSVPSSDLVIKNTSGSTAGSGSGDFHQYRSLRRKENFRLARMDREYEEKRKNDEYAKRREGRIHKEIEKTSKKAAKRRRAKENAKEREQEKQQQKKQKIEPKETEDPLPQEKPTSDQ